MDPSIPSAEQPSVYSSGYLVFRHFNHPQFLLMRHQDRWDLPKGHLDAGESKQQAALRELEEETGLASSQIWTDPDFVFEHRYWVSPRKTLSQQALKELTIYLGVLLDPVPIQCTEHLGHQWWDWSPPHRIQAHTIDPLLEQVNAHLLRSVTARGMLKIP